MSEREETRIFRELFRQCLLYSLALALAWPAYAAGPANRSKQMAAARLELKKTEDFINGCSLLYGRLAKPVGAAAQSVTEYPVPEQLALRPSLVPKYLYQFLQGRYPNLPSNAATDGFFRRAQRSTARTLGSLGKALLPVPSVKWRLNQSEKIFFALLKDPRYVPTPAEVEHLKANNLLATFTNRKNFLLSHPNAPKVQATLAYTKTALSSLGTVAAANQAYQMQKNLLTQDEYLEQSSEDENGNPKVELLVETTPFPHTALRIGNTVYSYGQEYMTATHFASYMSTMPPANASSSADRDFLRWLGDSLREKAERSVRVVPLKLDKAVIEKLQRDLTLNTQKRYHNRTLVNDCATMIKRALEANGAISIPAAIDAYPSASAAYLGLLHTLGDERVGEAKLVMTGKHSSPATLLARNAYISILETKFLVNSFNLGTNQIERAYIEMTYSDEDLQYYTEDAKQQLAARRQKVRAEMEARLGDLFAGDENGDDFFAAAAKLPDGAEKSEKIRAASSLLRSWTQEEIEKADSVINFPETDMLDLTDAAEKRETLIRVRDQYLERLKRL